MLHSKLVRRVFALLALLLTLGADAAAQAEQPFFYYPAYGANRGRIRYVDGVFRNKQRIHWGNGVTDNGVLVMRDLAAAAQEIVPAILPRGAESPEEGRGGLPEMIDGKTDAQWKSEADAIRQANQELLAKLSGGKPDAVDTSPVAPGAPAMGMRVLVIYEVKDRLVFTDEQKSVLNSTKIKEYLNTHCAKGKDGSPEWHMWDNDYPQEKILSLTNNDAAWWVKYDDARKAHGERAALIIYKDAEKVVDQELTDGEEETLELLKAHGGP
jgi:hypothetical protein